MPRADSVPQEGDYLLTAAELADLLRISPVTVRQYATRHPSRLPPSIRWGARRRWRRSDVDAWIAQLRTSRASRPGRPRHRA